MLQASELTEENNCSEPLLLKLIDQQPYKKCLVQVPLEFEFEPVEILTKQITKFNSNSQYRVLYLGPRWAHNHQVHKQLSYNTSSYQVTHPEQFGLDKLERYKVDINPKQRTYIMKVGNHFAIQKNTFYYRAFEGSNPTIKEQQDIRFDAHFESGNLDCAIKVNKSQYDLFLRIDSNTRGHTLWYYFSVSCKEKQRITINICNIMKHTNLYKKNMKPYIFSSLKHKHKGTGWEQGGDNLIFDEKELRYEFVYQKVGVRKLSQLRFQYQFEYNNDEVFFAYCVPYTYSLLLHQIEQLKSKTHNLNILEVQSLGTSLLGVKIPLLKITDCSIPMSQKKIVLITGRIHPGQSCGSLMTEGLIKYLCSSEGLQLRRQTVFIIVPMMNPDGVILGNYRTGVSGVDLNRVFQKLNKQIYPQVYHLKMLVKRLCALQPIYLYLDFHGHSSKKNAFSYGPAYKISDSEYYKAKLLPKLTALKTPMFRYYSCIFRIAEGKKDTARSVFFYEYNIPYTFTIEASNGSFYQQESKQTINFDRQKWREVGKSFGPSIQQFIELLQTAQRRQLVQTNVGVSRKRFGSPSKRGANESLGIFQQSLQLVPKKQIKNKYQSLIDEIKNDQRRHKKQQSDSEVSSDDDNIEDTLPKAKMQKLGKSIVQNCNIIQKNSRHKEIVLPESTSRNQKKIDMIDNIYNRKIHLVTKNRKIMGQKIEGDKRSIIHRLHETNTIIRKKSQNEIQSALNTQRISEDTDHRDRRHQYHWKSNLPYPIKGHSKRNVSAVLTQRNNVPKVQMSLDVDDNLNINHNRQQEQLKKLLQRTQQGKSRNRARSLSQTQKRKKRAREPVQSFLYPQVFHFEQFIQENNKVLTKLNKKDDSRKARYHQKYLTSVDNPKVSCPSAFYKIKQSLNNRKRDDSLTTLEKGVMIINTKKK